MENKIIQIVNQASDDSSKTTIVYHTLWPKNRSFAVSYGGFTNFVEDYCTVIYSSLREREKALEMDDNNYNPTKYGLSFAEESYNNRVPIMINIKIKATDNEYTSFYGTPFIYNCVSIIQESIVDLFELSEQQNEIICYCLESDIWRDDENQYVELRFQFPYTCIDIDQLNNIFIPHIISEFTSKNILHFLTVTPLNSLKEMIIPQTKIVVSCGCKKNASDAPLYLTNIYNYIEEDNIPNNDMDIPDITLSLENGLINLYSHSFISKNLLDSGNIILDDDETMMLWVPLMLSIHFNETISQMKQTSNIIKTPVPSSKKMKVICQSTY